VAACVNLIPGVVSTYRWEGGVQTDTERLLVVKTSEERIPDVQATIREMHDYEIPEILVVPVAGGSTDYLGWIAESVLP
jgi:periplasmic divalent cation tolerance protein